VRTVELEDELKSVRREMAQLRASEAKAKNDARSRERALKQEVDGLKQNINDLVEEVIIRFPRCYSSLSALRRGHLGVS
jgi:predicted  nucleic acid-binding Zn-ribbon protein